jgi:hypothetical protein
MKFGSLRRGSRNALAKVPAVVIEVSWPLFAALVRYQRKEGRGRARTHIRGNKHPLRQRIPLQITIKHSEILALR